MGRKIRSREGFIVDEDSGEVIDDSPLEASGDVFGAVSSVRMRKRLKRL